MTPGSSNTCDQVAPLGQGLAYARGFGCSLAKPHQSAATKLAGNTVEEGALANVGTTDDGDGVAVSDVEHDRSCEPRAQPQAPHQFLAGQDWAQSQKLERYSPLLHGERRVIFTEH